MSRSPHPRRQRSKGTPPPPRTASSFNRSNKFRKTEPDPETFENNNQLNLLAQRKKLSEALDLFQDMQITGHINDFSYGVMLNAYVRCGKIQEAQDFFERMKSRHKCRPSVVTYTTLMKGLCDDGRLQEAISQLARMEEEGLKPNIRTYNTLLRGCLVSGSVLDAEDIYDKIRHAQQVRPDVSTRDMIITLLTQGLKIKPSLKLLSKPVLGEDLMGVSPPMTSSASSTTTTTTTTTTTISALPLLPQASGSYLAVARAAAILRQWQLCQEFIKKTSEALAEQAKQERAQSEIDSSTSSLVDSKRHKKTSGGRRAKRQMSETRARSGQVFNAHRRSETSRALEMIKGFVQQQLKLLDTTLKPQKSSGKKEIVVGKEKEAMHEHGYQTASWGSVESIQHLSRLLCFLPSLQDELEEAKTQPSKGGEKDMHIGPILRTHLINTLRENFGLDLMVAGCADPERAATQLRKAFKHSISPHQGRLRFRRMFEKNPTLPLKLEICSGRGYPLCLALI